MAHESKLRRGVLVSEAADTVRLIGRVFGLGPEAAGCGVGFGDIVEVSRWNCGIDQGWWLDPQKLLDGVIHGPFLLADPDQPGQAIEATPYERFCFVTPEQVICRICSPGEEPGTWPVADRLLLEHEARPQASAGGVALAHYRVGRNALARVALAGPKVDRDDFKAGDWVMLDPQARATEIRRGDVLYTLAHAGDVLMNFGVEKPNDVEIQIGGR